MRGSFRGDAAANTGIAGIGEGGRFEGMRTAENSGFSKRKKSKITLGQCPDTDHQVLGILIRGGGAIFIYVRDRLIGF